MSENNIYNIITFIILIKTNLFKNANVRYYLKIWRKIGGTSFFNKIIA